MPTVAAPAIMRPTASRIGPSVRLPVRGSVAPDWALDAGAVGTVPTPVVPVVTEVTGGVVQGMPPELPTPTLPPPELPTPVLQPPEMPLPTLPVPELAVPTLAKP